MKYTVEASTIFGGKFGSVLYTAEIDYVSIVWNTSPFFTEQKFDTKEEAVEVQKKMNARLHLEGLHHIKLTVRAV